MMLPLIGGSGENHALRSGGREDGQLGESWILLQMCRLEIL